MKGLFEMGLFIDLEGLDGCGKTTQTELLCKRFEKENINYSVGDIGNSNVLPAKELLHKKDAIISIENFYANEWSNMLVSRNNFLTLCSNLNRVVLCQSA